MGDKEKCYKGENEENWTQAVKTINELSANIYPKVLEQDTSRKWKRVNPNFPNIDNFNVRDLEPSYVAFDFIHAQKQNIVAQNANKDEKRALEIFNLTKGFIKVMRIRIDVDKLYYDQITIESEELRTKEVNSDVHMMKIEYEGGKERERTEAKKNILERGRKFRDCKIKLEDSINQFKKLSQKLAEAEGLTFDEKFNKNINLNYHQFLKLFDISNKPIKDYYHQQEELWCDILKSLQEKPNKPVTHESSSKQQEFEHKMKMFKDMYNDTKERIPEATLEELKLDLKEIQDIHREQRLKLYDPDIQISEEDKLFISHGIKTLVRNITDKISEIENQQKRDSETRKQEIQSNSASMGPVTFTKLYGQQDWIPWKKSQKYLNTHTNEYKRAATIRKTLKNDIS